jgi:hypothetical protein
MPAGCQHALGLQHAQLVTTCITCYLACLLTARAQAFRMETYLTPIRPRVLRRSPCPEEQPIHVGSPESAEKMRPVGSPKVRHDTTHYAHSTINPPTYAQHDALIILWRGGFTKPRQATDLQASGNAEDSSMQPKKKAKCNPKPRTGSQLITACYVWWF